MHSRQSKKSKKNTFFVCFFFKKKQKKTPLGVRKYFGLSKILAIACRERGRKFSQDSRRTTYFLVFSPKIKQTKSLKGLFGTFQKRFGLFLPPHDLKVAIYTPVAEKPLGPVFFGGCFFLKIIKKKSENQHFCKFSKNSSSIGTATPQRP